MEGRVGGGVQRERGGRGGLWRGVERAREGLEGAGCSVERGFGERV